jgi:PKD repeat protein
LAGLSEVGCNVFGGVVTFRAEAGTTYYFLVGGLFGQGGPVEFRLEVAPPPVASFGFYPSDPSRFDVIQFFDGSFDPGGLGIASQAWHFGDGGSATGCCPTHTYATDGSYVIQLTVTTPDGRSASTSQTLFVRTHDVAIIKFSTPNAASSRQTRQITVGLNSRRYPEIVEVQLLKSVPGGYQLVGSLTQSVPVRASNRTTDFSFSYTFSDADAQIGKVTFKAVANLLGARDALPADNEAIAPPTKVRR